MRAPNSVLLYIASPVLSPNQHSVRSAHLTEFGASRLSRILVKRVSTFVAPASNAAEGSRENVSSSSELSSSDPSRTWCAPPPPPRGSRARPSWLATRLLSLSSMNLRNRA